MKNLSFRFLLLRLLGAVSLLTLSSQGIALEIDHYPPLRKMAAELEREGIYTEAELARLFDGARINQKVLKAMNRQSEALPWYRYRKIFLAEDRIERGVEFWREQRSTLRRVEERYGVPPEIVVALVGVETFYGARTGGMRVFDSLATLSAEYPRRSKFFTKELKTFLILTHQEGADPFRIKGSFAGAIGIPQFMPSSFQEYAVDFSGDGRRDLVNSFSDALGSIGNYLHRHDWKRKAAVVATLQKEPSTAVRALLTKRAKPELTLKQLREAGLQSIVGQGSTPVSLLRVQEEGAYRYLVGYENFYAITRYNPSVNYALAVWELSQEIKRRYRQRFSATFEAFGNES